MTKAKPPLYHEGELFCPHCKAPLLVDEDSQGKPHCSICKGEVDKLTEKTLMKMIDDFPADLLKEWLLEYC